MSDFKVRVWPTGEKIEIRRTVAAELRPVEMHIKPDGDLQDEPSIAFLLKDRFGRAYVAQISARMLRPGLEKLEEVCTEVKMRKRVMGIEIEVDAEMPDDRAQLRGRNNVDIINIGKGKQ